MDCVISFVDGLDPLWQQDFQKASRTPAVAKRYRDWGTLPFLLRGIEQHMPFIDKVFLVVARESQVPDWAERSRLQIVLHRDIIPEIWLPTFNSTTIEMFLYRIPGLSEQFIYFNDDIFPVMDCSPEDFFVNGKPAIGFARHCWYGNLYKRQTRQSDRLAREALGLRPGLTYLRPQHTCTPMLRSGCEEVFKRIAPQIIASLTPFRESRNVSQYLFTDFLYLSRRAVARRLSNRHISLSTATPRRLTAAITAPDRKLLCLNDVEMSQERFLALREAIHQAFSARFPEKSSYER